jgi:prepilin-type processing-associated H-X9-DG protein
MSPTIFTMTFDVNRDGKVDSFNVGAALFYGPDGDYYWYNCAWPRHSSERILNFLFADGSVRPFTLLEFCANAEQIWGSFDRP